MSLTEDDEREAQKRFETHFPDADVRRRCCAFFHDAILYAHQWPASWATTTPQYDCVRLNVGSIEIMTFEHDTVMLILDEASLLPAAEDWIRRECPEGLQPSELRAVPRLVRCRFNASKLEEADALLRPSLEVSIRRAAEQRSKCFFKEHHNPDVLLYLRGFLGTDVPDPDYDDQRTERHGKAMVRAGNLLAKLGSYDRAKRREVVERAEQLRRNTIEKFPLEAWPTMTLEQFALGHERSHDSFCYWMEFVTRDMGSMKGGSSRKHLIYKHKDREGWYFDRDTYANEQEAWQAVRGAFIEAFELAGSGRWGEIDGLTPLEGGPALRCKTLYIYFPNDLLPIFSKDHLAHFLRLMGRSEADDRKLRTVSLNRALLAAVRAENRFEGWSTKEIERFFYESADPRESRRVVKIAPGEGAKFWDDCLRGGYICVGWDQTGDLREFDSKADLRERFVREYGDEYKQNASHITKKAKELWTLAELEPGDIVVANQGTAHVLAVGEVQEPGYEWRPDREEYRHVVHVKWDTSVAKDIAPQKQWALVTVAKVPAELYNTILASAPTPVVDEILPQIQSALERKGQLILYGPPGTGKTYWARRFAVWWLRSQADPDGAGRMLTDPAAFARAESQLLTARVTRRVWWVVANPKEWSWDRLFNEGKVDYRYGRLKRHYPLVQPDDLVVGYQSTPDKRIVALAKVTHSFAVHQGSEPSIELAPLSKVVNGPTYDDLMADSVLAQSEPMRFRNQGTLFALTEEEGNYVLGLLAERDPKLEAHAAGDGAVGELTWLTFHPSYSYEDFIEGFRPTSQGGTSLALRLEDGIFKRVCREAQAKPDRKFLVLVDEINRANVAKVLGELITLLEKDKRGVTVTLPQSKESFCIPPNVYVLATMNTADRSIKLLDAALRRRFAFIELMPDVDILSGAKVGDLALDDFLMRLNERIARKEGREKQIGHSFLMNGPEPVTEPDDFVLRFRQDILPLLQEYCYDDYGALADFLGDKIVKRDEQVLDQEVLQDTDALLAALAEQLDGEE